MLKTKVNATYDTDTRLVQKQPPDVFCKKRCSQKFRKFTGKHLCQSLFFNKVAGLGPVTLTKKETLAQVFSCEICEISYNVFFTEHLQATASACYYYINQSIGLKNFLQDLLS